MGAFALFKFVQSAGSAAAFLYSTKLNLYYQLVILAVISTIATICFCVIEWNSRQAAGLGTSLRLGIEKTESQQNIITSDSFNSSYTGQRVNTRSGSVTASLDSLCPAPPPPYTGSPTYSSSSRSSSPPLRRTVQYLKNMLGVGAGGSGVIGDTYNQKHTA